MSVLLEYESIAIDPVEAGHNHSWKVMSDGKVFVRRNSSGAVRPISADIFWFENEYSTQEKYTLTSHQHDQLVLYLERFKGWPEYTYKKQFEETEHGGWDKLSIYFASVKRQIQTHSSQEEQIRPVIHEILELIRS